MEVISIAYDIIKDYIKLIRKFLFNITKFLKYQIITKGILSLIIIPLYGFLSGYLVKRDGTMMFTNGNILKFMLTPAGIAFLIFLFIMLVLELIIEIGGYITISCKIEGNLGESSYWKIFKYNIALLPGMASVGGIIMLLYVGFMTPMVGVGFKLSFLKGFSMPNFILSEIDQNIIYSIIYITGIVALIYVSLKFIFSFNYMIVYKMKPYKAIKASCRLYKQNRKEIITGVVSVFLITVAVAAVAIFLWLTLIVELSKSMNLNGFVERAVMLGLLAVQEIGIIVISMLIVPFECYYVTRLFYKFVSPEEKKYLEVPEKKKLSILDKLFKKKKFLAVLMVISIVMYSVVASMFTTEILGYNNKIDIYGHRGYGEGVPENSISAIKKAIDDKLDYIEIDVQRTKDRHYVLNHDKNFERVSYNKPPYIKKRVYELTLPQIEKLDIGSKVSPKYAGEKVPTLEEVLDTCKGKIKINLELKDNVDKKMMDDIMAMIEKKGMKKQVFLTSLNTDNIRYIEKKDPSFDTGIIYFIKLGDFRRFDSDYMIMEEREATEQNIKKMHKSGKKVIVWTIDTPDSLEKFSKSDVDGIITNYPRAAKKQVAKNSKLSMNDLILSSFLRDIEDAFGNVYLKEL